MNWKDLGRQALANAIVSDVTGFNMFRLNNPDWRPGDTESGRTREIGAACFAEGVDLRGANLSDLDMQGANLWKADLRHANLAGTNLMQANIIGVQIEEHQIPEFLEALGVKAPVAV